MYHNTTIYLRSEISKNECRTPLTPMDISRLHLAGFTIFVQKSSNRIYSDQEYANTGSQLTDLPWTDSQFQDALIIGLKTFPDLEKLCQHRHIYFSHSFQNQSGSDVILTAFRKNKSTLYDFEYMVDDLGKRLLAFGQLAGQVGAGLGLLQYFTKTSQNRNIQDLQSWTSKSEFIQDIRKMIETGIFAGVWIAVIGPNGRCGGGVREILNMFGLKYQTFDRQSSKNELLKFDIIFNCILLDPALDKCWIEPDHVNTCTNKPVILVDISCDVTKSNHPFRKLYQEPTTWQQPVLSAGPFFDVIALDNLPALLPKDSSDSFSAKFTDLLLFGSNNDANVWTRAAKKFEEVVELRGITTPQDKQLVSAYVVNFNDDDRRSRMTRRFEILGLPLHFTAPVYSSDPRLDIEGIKTQDKRTCSIMLQHLDSLQHFLENTSTEYCIVCEDDILVSKNLLVDLPLIINKFRELELDVILLGYLWPHCIDPDGNPHFYRLGRDEKYQYTRLPDDLWGSQMYMVSRTHAQNLLNMFPPEYGIPGDGRLPYNPDWTLTKKGKRALIYPMLAVEEGGSKLGVGWECEFHRLCYERNYVDGVHL